MPLTDAKIKSLKPKAKQYKVSDFDGLYVLIAPSGSKLWRLKYRFDGKEKSLAFGKYPYTTLAHARFQRDEARTLLARGIDPSEERKREKEETRSETEHSFTQFAEKYVLKLVKEGKSENTLSKVRWVLSFAIEDFGDTAINEIDAQTVLKTLRTREALGHYETAKRMRSTIGAVFRFAVASGVGHTDPTFALKDALIKHKTTHRAAITDKDKLAEYLKALDSYGGKSETRIGLWLLMLFATRPGEIRKARWDEFDIEGRVWSIPKERMKMRRPHSVPLSDKAVALLEELRTLTGWGALLFPSQGGAHKPISENTFNQALRRMGFGKEEVTSHGFRATFSTFANESGLWSPDAIEAYCARVDKNTIRRTYNRAAYWDERVKIADWWADRLDSGMQD